MASFHKKLDVDGNLISWYIMYQIGNDENGKRIQRKKSGFATKKEAIQWLQNTMKLVEKGIPVSAQKSKITLSEWIDIHMNSVIAISKTAKTHESYNSISKYWKNELGHIRLNDLTAAHIQNIVKKLVENGKSPRTVRNYVNYIRKVMGDAVQQDIAIRNPIFNSENGSQRINLPSVQKKAFDMNNTLEDIKLILNELKDTQYYAIVYLTANTGMRRGEILGLKWSDLDRKNLGIHVHSARINVTKSIQNQHTNTQGTKTHQDRFVPITENVISVLDQHKLKVKDFGYSENSDDYIFVSYYTGRPICITELSRIFKKTQIKLNTNKNIRFHDLRHFFASVVVDNNIPIGTLSQILGHSQISTTQNIYTHAIQRKQRQYAQQIFDAIGLGLDSKEV